MIPYGYRIERRELPRLSIETAREEVNEVEFEVVAVALGGGVIAKSSARFDRHSGCWEVRLGPSTSVVSADEARARAAALVMAADEVARRNGEED